MTTALEGVRCQRHASAALNPRKDLLSIVQEAVWVPGPVWTGAENLASTWIRSPDRPARSPSLYRLRSRLTYSSESGENRHSVSPILRRIVNVFLPVFIVRFM
jgi:hypothetical protein